MLNAIFYLGLVSIALGQLVTFRKTMSYYRQFQVPGIGTVSDRPRQEGKRFYGYDQGITFVPPRNFFSIDFENLSIRLRRALVCNGEDVVSTWCWLDRPKWHEWTDFNGSGEMTEKGFRRYAVGSLFSPTPESEWQGPMPLHEVSMYSTGGKCLIQTLEPWAEGWSVTDTELTKEFWEESLVWDSCFERQRAALEQAFLFRNFKSGSPDFCMGVIYPADSQDNPQLGGRCRCSMNGEMCLPVFLAPWVSVVVPHCTAFLLSAWLARMAQVDRALLAAQIGRWWGRTKATQWGNPWYEDVRYESMYLRLNKCTLKAIDYYRHFVGERPLRAHLELDDRSRYHNLRAILFRTVVDGTLCNLLPTVLAPLIMSYLYVFTLFDDTLGDAAHRSTDPDLLHYELRESVVLKPGSYTRAGVPVLIPGTTEWGIPDQEEGVYPPTKQPYYQLF